LTISVAGADPGGGAPGTRPPKIGKNMIFWRKIVIFHTKYPKKIYPGSTHFLEGRREKEHLNKATTKKNLNKKNSK
jgi:hypothetical protein